MRKAKRIDLSLFDDDVREMIQSGLSVLPITQEMVDGNLNPNNLVYGRVDRHIYMWLEGHWDYVIADDIDIKWADVKDKPTSYTPSEHSHSELHTHSNKTILDRVVDDNIHGHNNKPVLDSITSLLISTWNTVTGKADKTYVDTELDKKSNTDHTHPYSLDTHVHDERYYTEAEVDTKVTNINSAIDNKSDISHNHDGAYWTKTTPLPKGEKGDKPAHQWVGTSLAFENPNGVMGVAVDLKGDTPQYVAGSNIIIDEMYISATTDPSVTSHISNSGIHTDPDEKITWHNKTKIAIGSSKPVDGSIWYQEI